MLTARHVLTAAHCLEWQPYPSLDWYYEDFGVICVVGGVSDWTEFDDRTVQCSTSFSKHPSYDNDNFVNDIGIITLDQPLDMGKVGTLPLYDFDSLAVGTPAYVT